MRVPELIAEASLVGWLAVQRRGTLESLPDGAEPEPSGGLCPTRSLLSGLLGGFSVR